MTGIVAGLVFVNLINGKKIEVEYLRYNHSRTKQFGLLTYINLSELEPGMHKINIKKEYKDKAISEWTIPFYDVFKNN